MISERENELTEGLLFIPDAFERMTILTDQGGRVAPLTEDEQCEANYVEGCVADLWIAPVKEGELWEFRPGSGAPMVIALAALLCQIYSGSTAEEILSHETEILEKTGILRQLTPNRQEGAKRIVAKIKEHVTSTAQ